MGKLWVVGKEEKYQDNILIIRSMKNSHAKSINCNMYTHTHKLHSHDLAMWVGVYKIQLKQHIEEGKKQSIHSILEKRLEC